MSQSQNEGQQNETSEAQIAEAKKPVPQDNIVTTEKSVVIDGQTIHYTATTGTIILKDKEEKAKASLFFMAYTMKDVEGLGKRPVTFSFNGGPGSASVWMHLGMLGPRRVISGDAGKALPPPYRLADNEYSLLDRTDLVFIDPISTGYSRPVEGEEAKQFHSVETDVEWVGEFIRLYITRNRRWSSPKFIIGESYGTTRAAGLSGFLQNRHGMYLNGLMLISSVLDFQTLLSQPNNDLPFIFFLPTYTATAWYHGKLDDELQQDLRQTLDEVEAFAREEYTLALMAGASLSDEKRAQVVEKLARYTGLSPAYVEQSNLRINMFRFAKELRRDEGRTIGRIDSRFQGIDRDKVSSEFEYDPSTTAIQGAYTATLNEYVRNELEFESDLPYEVLSGLYKEWDYTKHSNKYLYVAETLREAMTYNPHLKVFVANGYYDLATPYFATEYTFNHLGIDADLQDNISMAYYEAGHMMYIHEPSLVKIKADLAHFLDECLKSLDA